MWKSDLSKSVSSESNPNVYLPVDKKEKLKNRNSVNKSTTKSWNAMFYVIQIEKTLENLFRKSLLLFFFLLGFVHLSYSYLCSFSLFSRSSNVIFHRFYQKQLCCTQSTRKSVSFYLINNFIISSSDKWLSVVVVHSIPFLFRLFFLFESF